MSANCCCERTEKLPAGEGQSWVIGKIETDAGAVCTVKNRWTAADRWGAFRARSGNFRMKYRVEPGLYALGSPDTSSPVAVTANYKLSFDHARRDFDGLNLWLLVLDTKGINVWCAAGKGTFGTGELVRRIKQVELDKVVTHRIIILPQLGAVGVSAQDVHKETGFRVSWGPVRAGDLKAYLGTDEKATPEMRTVRFGMRERLVLVPMELRPAAVKSLPYALLLLFFLGLEREGVLFRSILHDISVLLLGCTALFTGAVITPLLLPYIPFRAFSLKGFVTGLFGMAAVVPFTGIHDMLLLGSAVLFFPIFSSFLALNFTGSTPFTGLSGVQKEMKYAVPVYITGTCVAVVMFLLYKIKMFF